MDTYQEPLDNTIDPQKYFKIATNDQVSSQKDFVPLHLNLNETMPLRENETKEIIKLLKEIREFQRNILTTIAGSLVEIKHDINLLRKINEKPLARIS